LVIESEKSCFPLPNQSSIFNYELRIKVFSKPNGIFTVTKFMKICPQCQKTYTDDMMFCLDDGTALTFSGQSANAGLDEPATVIQQPRTTQPTYPQTTSYAPPVNYAQPPEKKSDTLLVVLVTVFLTVFVVAGIFVGIYLYSNRGEKDTAGVTNQNNPKKDTPTPEKSVTPSATPTEKPSPTATPTPVPTAQPEEIEAAQTDINDLLEGWRAAAENIDLDGNMSYYADTIDYYKAGKVNISRVRADKKRAYDTYDTISAELTNIKITPDPTGQKATAVFDKTWTFESEEKYSNGSVKQQLDLKKINGRWLIVGEKDLQVYYVNKE
jgi:hypothetical protein